ncbi:MAG TPA: hypothetical protein VF762_07445 [Blastocatellia bacterium]|jgi:ABC-type Fe3+-citrate transport system substrate-binding protein
MALPTNEVKESVRLRGRGKAARLIRLQFLLVAALVTACGVASRESKQAIAGDDYFPRTIIAAEQITRIDPHVILVASGYERDSGFRQRLEADAQLSTQERSNTNAS